MSSHADLSHVLTLEQDLRELSDRLTEPEERECLPCFVRRMLEHGCTGLRWATRFLTCGRPGPRLSRAG